MRSRALSLALLFTAFLWSLPPAAAQSPGDLVVTEMMPNPDDITDANGEWVEIFNPTGTTIDLDGWMIGDNDSDSHPINGEVVVPANGFALLCHNGDSETNGGLACDYEYSSFTLANGADEIILTAPDGTEVDRVEYDDEAGWSGPSEGVSMVFTGSSGADNNDPSTWAEADVREPRYSEEGNDLGSPGTEGYQQNLTSTTVQFTAAGGTVGEGDGTATLTVILANPDGNEIIANVVFESGFSSADVADLDGYVTETVTFPATASDGATQDVTITLTDDDMAEGTETAVFALKNVTGGAEAGYPAEFSLVIKDSESARPPALFISEVADPSDVGHAKFVEIYNGTGHSVDLDAEAWYLSRQANGEGLEPIRLTGFVDAGGVYIVGRRRGEFSSSYEFEADQYSARVSGDGNDGYFLYRGGDHESGTLVDAFGRIDEDGTDTDWEYTDSRAVRKTSATAPNPSFDISEWAIDSAGVGDMTPGEHPLSGRRMAGLKGWRMLAPAVEGLSVGDLAAQNLVQGVPGAYPGADVNLYTAYDESQGGWVPAQGTGETLASGKGFIWYLFEDSSAPEFASLPFTLRATGSPPAGDVEVSVPDGQAFHLLGNPYNASYDLSGLNLTEQGFSAVVQVWDPGAGGGVGSYVSLTREYGTEDRVGPWQGFFVEHSTGSATTLTFSSDKKTSGGAFYGLTADVPRRKIGLCLTARDASGQELARDEAATLYFHPEATAEWDSWDASKLQPLSSPSATLAFEGERGGRAVRKAQESRPYDPGRSFEVPLAFAAEDLPVGEAIHFTIEWPRLERIPEHWHITLWDRKTGEEVNLQAESSYTFIRKSSAAQAQVHSREAASSLAAGPQALQQQAVADEAPRFVLRFGGAALPVELASFEAQVQDEHAIALTWKTLSEEANRGFAIERRAAEDEAFEQVGFVEGAGAAQRAQRYRFVDGSVPYGVERLTYRLGQIDLDGQAAYSDTVAVTLAPERFELLGNHPNPFRVATTLRYTLPEDEHVTVEVYDALGRRVATLLDEEQQAGWKALRFEAHGLSSGLYLYRVTAGKVTRTRKMLLVR